MKHCISWDAGSHLADQKISMFYGTRKLVTVSVYGVMLK
jgi:hypothetical protein